MHIFQIPSTPTRKSQQRLRGGNHRRLPRLDALEVRRLLTTINEYQVPLPSGGGASGLQAITTGPDGNLWFTEDSIGKIGRMTPSGVLTEFPLQYSYCQPVDITAGPDGNLWFTESAATPVDPNHVANHIGRITPSGVITEFAVPSVYCGLLGITAGPDGNLWFTEEYGDYSNGDKIGKITPNGVVTEYDVPTNIGEPTFIAAGADGNLWFTEFSGNEIARITPSGVITEFALPAGNSQPRQITLGPDGNVWFTEYGPGYVGRITPSGVITEFPNYSLGVPGFITTGPDGNLWVTEDTGTNGEGKTVGNSIAQYTTAGQATDYPIPTTNGEPNGITVGPDHHIWFTEYNSNKIGQLIAVPTAVSVAAPAVSSGADGVVTVTVTSSSSSETPSGNVSLTVNGTKYTSALTNGIATIDVGVLPDGEYEATADFIDQGDFEASTATGVLQVTPTSWSGAGENEYSVPLPAAGGLSGVASVTSGADGNLWFTEYLTGKIGRMTPSGDVTLFPLLHSNSEPYALTTGPDGNVWFAESAATSSFANRVANRIGRITPDGAITEFDVPTVFSEPLGIATGPDGNLWFTEYATNQIGRVTPAGQFTEFPIPRNDSEPYTMTAGPDGNLWFTEFSGNQIGRITPAGVITEFPLPRGNSQPVGITAGPDGNLWFTEYGGQAVGRITPDGVIIEYLNNGFSGGEQIVAGPDGNLWFTQVSGNYVVRISPTGQPTFFSSPTPGGRPSGITVGPDNNIWYTEYNANKIVQLLENPVSITLSAPAVTYGADGLVTVTVASSSTTNLSGTVSLTVDSTSYGGTVSNGVATIDVGKLNAGAHTLAASFADPGVGKASTSGTLVVNPALLMVTAVNQTMNHGDPVPALTDTITGFVNGDTASVVSGAADLSTAATSSSPAGAYPITLSLGTLSAANYTFELINGTLAVQPKVVDVRVDYGSKSISLLGLNRDLPFVDIQAIDVIFSDDVAVNSAQLVLTGINVSSYKFSGFRYDATSQDAMWTLAAPLDVDRLAMTLAGETFAANPAIAVDPFATKFAVLPGDVNGDSVVNSQDIVDVRNEFLGIGDASLISWADLDGDGVVNLNDYNLARRNVGKHLP